MLRQAFVVLNVKNILAGPHNILDARVLSFFPVNCAQPHDQLLPTIHRWEVPKAQ